ncbi:LOW QUALITY PROTEIN: ATP-binding cassette sub-family C member 4-like [Glandiceps talaboti]
MDESKEVTAKVNPYKNANKCSRLFFCWLNQFHSYGHRNQVTKADLYPVAPWDASDRVSARLEEEWEREVANKSKEGKDPSLAKAVMLCFGARFMFWAIFILFEEALKLIQPILLGKLIDYFSPSSGISENEAYAYATGVCLCTILHPIVHHPHYHATLRLGMHLRIASCSMIYKKALRLSNTAFQKTTTGQMSNLMSNDVSRFDRAVTFLHYLWIGPLQALVIFGLLVYEIGWVCVFAYILLVLLVPFQSILGKYFGKLRKKTAVLTDERVRLMDEIVNAMRVIKMYAWEKPFSDMVFKIRTSEIAKVVAATVPMSVNLTIGLVGNRALDLVLLASYAATTDYMKASTMYIIIMYCSTLRGTFLRTYPRAVQVKNECTVSLNRIQALLQLPEHEQAIDSSNILAGDQFLDTKHTKDGVKSAHCQGTEISVCIEDMNASWTNDDDSYVLKNINLKMTSHELLGVIGPVGSGKSSLLVSLLGELPQIDGVVKCTGTPAYAAQQPWIFSGTVRQNILFGKEYNQERFSEIVYVCALEKDMQILPKGDLTPVGERGVTLSGGQKARVSLARALYHDADIYLLDDPLSAVDSEVGRHIFEKCIKGYLRNKLVILVTHQLQFVGSCDRVLVLREGKEEALGPLDEIMKSGINVTSFLKSEDKNGNGDDDDDEEEEELDSDDIQTSIPLPGHKKMGSVHRRSTIRKQPKLTESMTGETKTSNKGGGGLIKEEQKSRGRVSFGTYKDYFAAGGGWLRFTWLVTVMVGAQAIYILSDLWISVWADTEEWRYENDQNRTYSDVTCVENNSPECSSGMTEDTGPYGDFISGLERYMFTVILLGIVVITFIIAFYRGFYFFRVVIKSSKNLHNAMFKAVLRAPIRFFDTNPGGRILNRVTKDIGIMDDQLPMLFFDVVQKALMILGILIVCCIINPIIIIPTVPIVIIFIYLRYYTVQTTREVKRLDGTTRSPVYSHLAASVQGLWTIRAFQMEDKFTNEFHKHQNANTQAWFMFLATSRWFAIRLDWLAAAFITFVIYLSVPAAKFEWINAGLAGLILSNAISLSSAFQFTVRQSALVENMMTAVERVVEYTKLDPEAPLEKDEHKPPDHWPRYGGVTIEHMCLQYATEEPFVLKDVTCQILPQEKVGIVGRTGAGKSSLVTALFRLAEPDGGLCIDGLDIKNMGLHDVRKKLSIIPQDPVLFTDSVRRNLDPFDQYNDNDLWTVLTEVQLQPAISEMAEGLDSSVGERGSNLSVGQRQLVCLARAVLKGNRILVLDEATANVDPRTDELIQETIRKKFSHCTVLTVAHRLHTVMDADRIMVLNEGRMVEFDSPCALLQNTSSFLNAMVDKTGRNEASKLREMAKRYHKERITNGSQPIIPTYQLANSRTDVNSTSPPQSNYQCHRSTQTDNVEMGTLHGHSDHTGQDGGQQNSNANIAIITDGLNEHEGENTPVSHAALNGGELHFSKFHRGSKGFGFSIAGREEDTGVPMWISKVETDSPAHLEGDLKIGDEIIEINGTSKDNLTCADVVNIITHKEGSIRLLVKRVQHTTIL